jgi:sugar O-acyltransferase (sialic acid O-acetyltransferase NeuD family)
MERQRIVIYGAGGWASCCLHIIRAQAQAGAPLECAGFVVDDEFFASSECEGLPVRRWSAWAGQTADAAHIIGIGSPSVRRRVADQLAAAGGRFATLTHPRAWVADGVSMGEGSVIFAGAMVAPNASIGRQCTLNLNVTIGHDNALADFVTIGPGVNIASFCRIGEGVEFGAGAVVIPEVTIGAWSIIGAGTVVTKDVPPNSTVVGVPGRVIATRPAGWHQPKVTF